MRSRMDNEAPQGTHQVAFGAISDIDELEMDLELKVQLRLHGGDIGDGKSSGGCGSGRDVILVSEISPRSL